MAIALASLTRWPELQDKHGAIAQLGEHLLCKQGVGGSIPPSSTNFFAGTVSKEDEYVVFPN